MFILNNKNKVNWTSLTNMKEADAKKTDHCKAAKLLHDMAKFLVDLKND